MADTKTLSRPDGLLKVNARFGRLSGEGASAIVPVINKNGVLKVLCVRPGQEHRSWFVPEWKPREGGGKVLVSLALNEDMKATGACFTEHAFNADGSDGKKNLAHYRRFVEEQFFVTEEDEDGNKVKRRRSRPRIVGAFPKKMHPKYAIQLAERAQQPTAPAEWSP